ncbi:MAG: cell division protein FtsA [Lentisphaeria bacterium]|nr:cell division protein FtsA [Lentisphaeria bacterium]
MAKGSAIVSAIEIGTSQINILVGEVTGDSVSIIGRGGAPSGDAVVKGEIRNMESAAKALEQALTQADDSSGNQLLRSQLVTLLISGGGVLCTSGIGTAAVRNQNGVVGEDEMNEARSNAQVIELASDWKIINTDDIYWRLDNRRVGNPLNQRGRKLEVKALIVQGHVPRLDNFANLIKSSELENAELYPVYAPICAKEGILTDREVDDGAVLIDMGAGCTDYLVAHDGGVLEAGTLQLGFDHVANDLAIGLGLSFTACRKLFESGTLKNAFAQNQNTLRIESPMGGSREIPLSQFETIIEARLREIFEEVARKVHVPGGQTSGVLTGGGALYPPALEIFTKVFGIPCREGIVADASGSLTNLDSPRYSAVWGALKVAAYYYRSFYGKNREGTLQNLIEGMNNIWLYLPRWIGKLWKAFKF